MSLAQVPVVFLHGIGGGAAAGIGAAIGLGGSGASTGWCVGPYCRRQSRTFHTFTPNSSAP